MASFGEMSKMKQVVTMLVLAGLITAGLYFGLFKGLDDENTTARAQLAVVKAQVAELKRYQNDIPRLNQRIASLKQQLDIQRRIVPDETEADQFMHMLQNTAQSSGIEIRRWTAKPGISRDYYVEVPFDLELDGPYYSVLNFFEKVAHLERIVNISNLSLTALKADSGGKRSYQYAPHETVIGSCTATTYFSRDLAAAAKPAGK
jgi:type IV pilus assembly protein PilO